jgi:hypothetical protein
VAQGSKSTSSRPIPVITDLKVVPTPIGPDETFSARVILGLFDRPIDQDVALYTYWFSSLLRFDRR